MYPYSYDLDVYQDNRYVVPGKTSKSTNYNRYARAYAPLINHYSRIGTYGLTFELHYHRDSIEVRLIPQYLMC